MNTEVLDFLRPDFSRTVSVLGGVDVRPVPAVTFAAAMSMDEAFAELVEDASSAFSDDDFYLAVVDPDQLLPVMLKLVEAATAHLDDRLRSRILSNRGTDFIQIAVTAFECSLPRDIRDFFPAPPPSTGSSQSRSNVPTVEREIDDVAVSVMKMAYRLAAAGFPDAYTMSWTRLLFADAVDVSRSIDDLERVAIGTRVGGADTKGWLGFLRGIGR